VSVPGSVHKLGAFLAIGLLRQSMRLGFVTALTAFFLLACSVLIDQWIAGQVSMIFLLGTALLLAGLCTGLFAAVAGIGLALSMLFDGDRGGPKSQMPDQQPDNEPNSDEPSPLAKM
jgi:hypothetical protein